MESGINKSISSDLESFQTHLLDSNIILAVLGAGLSASSGLATFRGEGGLWRNYSPIDLATPEAFQIDPGLVWQFYSSRRYAAMHARPNRGHFALAELSRRMKNKSLTLTQNVDGLSTRAGHDKERILELHGSLFTLKCTGFFCNYVEENNREHPLTPALLAPEEKELKRELGEVPKDRKKRKLEEPMGFAMRGLISSNDSSTTTSPELKAVESIPESDLPHCPRCNELLRPGVVWFGESLPLTVMDTADDFLLNNKVDLVLVIGTSGSVWPAMGYVERVQRQGGKVAIFNTEVDVKNVEKDGGWGFVGDAAKWLPLALEPLIGSDYLPRNWKKL